MKVELLQGAYARQGKETGHLVGTREVLRDSRAVGCHLEREVGLATVVARTLTSRSNDNGRLREIIIKCLMEPTHGKMSMGSSVP